MKNFYKISTSILVITLSLAVHSSESIGKYSDGRIKDSLDLEKNNYGLQHMRRSRNAYHGHDHMIEFLRDIASDSYSKGNGQLLVSDISAEHGGNLSGHASHQIGLDVDIWFWRPDDSNTNLSDSERENLGAPIYLDPKTNQFVKNRAWDTRLDNVFKDVALDNRVARVFVNPGVKKRLCQKYPGQKWLSKIRPWWRHHEHLHVRLKCPKDSPKCVPQAEPTAINCDTNDLNWWFSDDFKREYRRRYGKAMVTGEYPVCDVE